MDPVANGYEKPGREFRVKTVWREELRGFAYGIFFMSAFGFVWASTGSSALPGGSAFVLTADVVVSLALISAGLYLLRAARFMPELPEGAMSSGVWRRFRIVGVVEGVAILAAVFVLGRAGRPEWIPAVVALIVGLHFFPLASIFRVRAYHATGFLLCAVFVVTVILATASGVEAVWLAMPGLGSAVVLWATGAFLAVSGLAGIRSSHAERKAEPK